MKYELLRHRDGADTIAVLFAGWGMDSRPFLAVDLCCDFAVVYDYNDWSLDDDFLNSYHNVYLFAWSFGVFAADVWLNNTDIKVCRKVAINGTLFPIEDNKGIPEAIFKGTYDNLSERTLAKFQRRMCISSDQFALYQQVLPLRSIESLRSELLSVYDKYKASSHLAQSHWDKVYVGERDYIFPKDNQCRAWADNGNVVVLESAHMPESFQSLLSANIIDKSLLSARFAKNQSTYEAQASVQQSIAKTLFERLKQFADISKIHSLLELGCGTGFLSRCYARECASLERVVLNDIWRNDALLRLFPQSVDVCFECADAEVLSFISECERFDCVLSSSVAQWFVNPASFFHRLSLYLQRGAMIAFSTFGPKNMQEVTSASKQGLCYLDIERLSEMLCTDYDVVSITENIIQIDFPSAIDVLRHLKATGVNALSSERKIWTQADIAKFISAYPSEDDGLCRLTYHPIYIIAKKK